IRSVGSNGLGCGGFRSNGLGGNGRGSFRLNSSGRRSIGLGGIRVERLGRSRVHALATAATSAAAATATLALGFHLIVVAGLRGDLSGDGFVVGGIGLGSATSFRRFSGGGCGCGDGYGRIAAGVCRQVGALCFQNVVIHWGFGRQTFLVAATTTATTATAAVACGRLVVAAYGFGDRARRRCADGLAIDLGGGVGRTTAAAAILACLAFRATFSAAISVATLFGTALTTATASRLRGGCRFGSRLRRCGRRRPAGEP